MKNKKLNPQLRNIFKLAQKQKQEDVMNVIRHTSAKIDVLKNKQEDKLGVNFETQLEILIASEENPKLRENLKEYCQYILSFYICELTFILLECVCLLCKINKTLEFT